MADLGQAKTRTPQWVLDHLSKRQLEKMHDHLQQINLIAKSSGLWDFQRTGFFKQTEAFQKKVRKAAEKDVYGRRVDKSLKVRQKRRK